MPFFNHIMARSVKKSLGSLNNESSATTPAMNRKTRSLPGTATKDSMDIYKLPDPQLASKYRTGVKMRKLLFMQSMLREQVDQLLGAIPPYSVEAYINAWRAYKIDKNLVRHSSAKKRVYAARSVNRPDLSVAAWVISRTDIDSNSSVQLKILRRLSSLHPFIIHTFELFCDQQNVYIFQEWAIGGNLIDYLARSSEPLEERKAALWAKQIYRALDFLGDLAIAHRDISPNHLVVQPQSATDTWLKLTGFSKSIIYWDVNSNDIQFCKCLPLERQKGDGANFQPPEVYGNSETEQFDPIQADIWSYGASILYMLAKQYPYNVVDPANDLDEEISHNIEAMSSRTEQCRNFVFALLRANANDRMPFDFIDTHPWFKANSTVMILSSEVLYQF